MKKIKMACIISLVYIIKFTLPPSPPHLGYNFFIYPVFIFSNEFSLRPLQASHVLGTVGVRRLQSRREGPGPVQQYRTFERGGSGVAGALLGAPGAQSPLGEGFILGRILGRSGSSWALSKIK